MSKPKTSNGHPKVSVAMNVTTDIKSYNHHHTAKLMCPMY